MASFTGTAAAYLTSAGFAYKRNTFTRAWNDTRGKKTILVTFEQVTATFEPKEEESAEPIVKEFPLTREIEDLKVAVSEAQTYLASV